MSVSLETGLRRQLARRDAALAGGARQVGWKVAWNHASAQRRLGVGGPSVGYLLDATVQSPDAPVDLAGAVDDGGDVRIGVEVEIALWLGLDATIDRVALAVEVLHVTGDWRDPEVSLAANAWHRAAVVSPVAAPYGPRTLDGVEVEAAGLGRGLAPTPIGAAVGNLDAVVDRVGQTLDGLGERLRPGDLVLSGSVAEVPLPARPGDRLHVAGGRLGTLHVVFS